MADTYQLGTVVKGSAQWRAYEGMLSIPYTTATGVVGVKFRRMSGEGVKYLAPAGQPVWVYNARTLVGVADTVAVCEGELDAVICEGVLGIPAVGIPGVNAWKPHLRRLFAGQQRVLVIGDHDEDKADGSNPGKEFTRRVTEDLADVTEAIPVELPQAGDLTDYVLGSSSDEVREFLVMAGREEDSDDD